MEAALVEPTVSPTVLIFDEHLLLGEAMRALLEAAGVFAVSSVVTDERTLAAEIRRFEPDLLLFSLSPDGAALGGSVLGACEECPDTRVVLLVDHLDNEAVELCLSAGVRALLEKTERADSILAALDQVLSDHIVLPAGWRSALPAGRAAGPAHGLSERQLEVLRLMVGGLSNREIAGRLYISVNTVKFHLRAIFRELGVRNRVDA